MEDGSESSSDWRRDRGLEKGRHPMDLRGNGVYISSGAIAIIVIIILLLWLL
jgi:hypothetical protein